jgi:hypothetical protein
MTSSPHTSTSTGQAPDCIPDDALLTVSDETRSAFWRARYLRQVDFLPHVPFLFWLLDLSQAEFFVGLGIRESEGVAHFAACQALDRLRQAPRCVGIDDWIASNKRIPEEIANRSCKLYEEISELIVKAPQEAVLDFDEASIDVLLIDMNLLPEAMATTLDEWLPRLSTRSVILLHGLRDACFQDRTGQAVLTQLKNRFSMFTLPHARGLGVVLSGTEQHPHLVRLAELEPSDPFFINICSLFARLGEANRFEYDSRSFAHRMERAEAEEMRLAENLKQHSSAYEARTVQLAEFMARNHDMSLKITALEASLAELKEIAEERKHELDIRFVELAALTCELERQRQTEKQMVEAVARSEDTQKAVARLVKDNETRVKEVAILKRELKKITGQLTKAEHERNAHKAHVDELLASTSWKITRPARQIVTLLRAFR